jgi:ribonuclease P protein component
MSRRTEHEKNLSTQQPPSRQDARISKPHGHQGRPESISPPSDPRPEAPGDRLISSPRPTYRFPRSSRITQRADFQRVYRFGRRIETRFFVLYVRKNELPTHRLGITASKKMGNAVVRNRLKRLFREAFRKNPMPFECRYDIVINSKKSAKSGTAKELEQEYRNVILSISDQKNQ